jgi:hypothetical protein
LGVINDRDHSSLARLRNIHPLCRSMAAAPALSWLLVERLEVQ